MSAPRICRICGGYVKQLTPGNAKLVHRRNCPRHPKNRPALAQKDTN
jgi:hypothetical protein